MNYDQKHRIRTFSHLREIERALEILINTTASLALKTKLKAELFQFKKHKTISKEIEKALQNYYNTVYGSIITGISQEWNFANEKYNALKLAILNRISSKIPKEILIIEMKGLAQNFQNANALKVFQNRKINGFTLSERVWKLTKNTRKELEFAIDVSLSNGQSANELARAIKDNLKYPDKLFRRVKDKHGNLVISKNAEIFNPGTGVYRSSHQNALRLASNEINMAYRESEQLRIMQNNDVVGVEIRLSPSHKIYDMCDELAGTYPKDFKWNMWHTNCMCHRVSILKSDEEFIHELRNRLNLPPESSKNHIANPNANFKKWIDENQDRFAKWKRNPNFLEDNKRYWE